MGRGQRFGWALIATGCFGCLALAGCDRDAFTFGDEAPPELLPLELLFGNPDRVRPRLSPDGTHIAWLAPHEGVLNIWVAPADALAEAQPITSDTGRGIRRFHWAYSNQHILYSQDEGGDENFHVHAVNIETGASRDLTPFDGARAEILERSPSYPRQVLLAINDRDPNYFDAYRVDITNGERERVFRNERFASLLADDDLRIHFATEQTPDGGARIYRVAPDGSTEPFTDIPQQDDLGTQLIEVAGKSLYMLDSRERDTAALFEIDLPTGDRQLLYGSERADVSGLLLHPITDRPQAAAVTYLRRRWEALDPVLKADFRFLRRIGEGEIEVVSRTLADDRWLIALTASDEPPRYFLYDRDPRSNRRSARFLFSTYPELAEAPLAPMQATVIESRDGLRLPSYLTLPTWHTTPDGTRPRQRLPLVLLVHGGPWARDDWRYDPHHQWLANRGYAVLSVNFRGSTGFGKSFVNAGDKEWGAAMHQDLIDAVQWAVDEGIARAQAVAIMGGSYGGYATLVGLTSTPERFACGVDVVGPSNLITLLEAIPPYWKPMRALFKTRVGDITTEAGRELLRERSPLTHVERIRRPLLIGQGANDPRVKQRESDQIVQAMLAREIPATYVLFPDEGHGFARPQNRLAFNAIADRFLAQCLDGRAEPITTERLEDASIHVPVGAAAIAGLPEALAGLPGDRRQQPGEPAETGQSPTEGELQTRVEATAENERRGERPGESRRESRRESRGRTE